MLTLFKKTNKNNRSRSLDGYIALAIQSGFIEQKNGGYTITEHGVKNGCYRTRAGGIGFSARCVALLLSRAKEGNQYA